MGQITAGAATLDPGEQALDDTVAVALEFVANCATSLRQGNLWRGEW